MPAAFQKAMDRTSNHAKNTICFLDDIFIVSKGNEIEHEKLVKTVLKKMDEENLALKISKSEFFKQQVNWLGHHLSELGVSPKLTEKLRPLLKEKKQKKQLKNMKLPVEKIEWGMNTQWYLMPLKLQ